MVTGGGVGEELNVVNEEKVLWDDKYKCTQS